MARVAGVNLPDQKRTDIGLTTIYGIGRQNVNEILKKAQVSPAKKIADLTAQEVVRLTKVIEKLAVEGTLRKQISEHIKRLKAIGTYRGLRHSQGLPARGQRTRSNARTKRGKRKTVGAMKKKDMSRLGGAEREKKEEKS